MISHPSSRAPGPRASRRQAIATAGAWAVLLVAAPVRAATHLGPPPAASGDAAALPVLSGTVGRVDAAQSIVVIESVPYAFAAGLPPVAGERAGRPVVPRPGMRVRFQATLTDGRQRLVTLSEAGR